MDSQFFKKWKFWTVVFSVIASLMVSWFDYYYFYRPKMISSRCFSYALENSSKKFIELQKNAPDLNVSLGETSKWHEQVKIEIEKYRLSEYENCMIKNGINN